MQKSEDTKLFTARRVRGGKRKQTETVHNPDREADLAALFDDDGAEAEAEGKQQKRTREFEFDLKAFFDNFVDTKTVLAYTEVFSFKKKRKKKRSKYFSSLFGWK